MTAAYMDWNDNVVLHFLSSLKDFLEKGIYYPRVSNGKLHASKQINLNTFCIMLLCLEEFEKELGNCSEW